MAPPTGFLPNRVHPHQCHHNHQPRSGGFFGRKIRNNLNLTIDTDGLFDSVPLDPSSFNLSPTDQLGLDSFLPTPDTKTPDTTSWQPSPVPLQYRSGSGTVGAGISWTRYEVIGTSGAEPSYGSGSQPPHDAAPIPLHMSTAMNNGYHPTCPQPPTHVAYQQPQLPPQPRQTLQPSQFYPPLQPQQPPQQQKLHQPQQPPGGSRPPPGSQLRADRAVCRRSPVQQLRAWHHLVRLLWRHG